jgi:hypothetical protein
MEIKGLIKFSKVNIIKKYVQNLISVHTFVWMLSKDHIDKNLTK